MPAAIRQVASLLDRHLNLIAPRGRYYVDRLRAVGLMPNTPGVPEPATAEHIALLLVSAMIGPSPALPSAEYLRLVSDTGGTLLQALERFLAAPQDLFELGLDTISPAALIRFREPNGNIAEESFLPETDMPRSKIRRIAIVDGNAFNALAIAIRTSTIPTRSRRRRRRRIS
ncbi:hypothetical protein C5L14_23245 [Labrys okinawensis]|uniref:Uncharacterized protein n=1 Tax=Labrys okinawensis TaxID=346911 RepID=A0A2S9Q7P3_9HYPH|nr:hypothetical protein [Labrys okinawensis]PRH85359.1 hypothetical protein C5L14_23245 [Labrys okinawensis]